jgi:hypothetical protein
VRALVTAQIERVCEATFRIVGNWLWHRQKKACPDSQDLGQITEISLCLAALNRLVEQRDAVSAAERFSILRSTDMTLAAVIFLIGAEPRSGKTSRSSEWRTS